MMSSRITLPCVLWPSQEAFLRDEPSDGRVDRATAARGVSLGQAPRYLVQASNHAFDAWAKTAIAMEIDDLRTAPHSPWQNAYVERFISFVRRECLDHIIVCTERGLRRVLHAYVEYYQRSRTHLALDKDAPSRGRLRRLPRAKTSWRSPGGWPAPPVRTPRRIDPASHTGSRYRSAPQPWAAADSVARLD